LICSIANGAAFAVEPPLLAEIELRAKSAEGVAAFFKGTGEDLA
jgi:hypothetical protein